MSRAKAVILAEIEAELQKGSAQLERRERLAVLVDHKRKLGESQARRTRELKLTLSFTELDLFISRVLTIMNEELEAHPDVAERIALRIKQYAGIDDSEDDS